MKHTASFLNHFLTSALMLSHSLSANLTNFESTSTRDSNIAALALNAFAIKHQDYNKIRNGYIRTSTVL